MIQGWKRQGHPRFSLSDVIEHVHIYLGAYLKTDMAASILFNLSMFLCFICFHTHFMWTTWKSVKTLSQAYMTTTKLKFPGGESNPGVPCDRRGYLPLYYRGHIRNLLKQQKTRSIFTHHIHLKSTVYMKKTHLRQPGIEPRCPAWQAGVITTILPRAHTKYARKTKDG